MTMLSALECVKAGVMAEKYGFDSLWVSDHFVDVGSKGTSDPWGVLAVIASQTKKILLFTGVTDAQRCHPARIAHSVATLDELSRGRAGLGIGAGEAMNIVPFAMWWNKDPKERVHRLRETIEVIKLLWRSSNEKRVSYQGKYFQLRNTWLDRSPTQRPHPPVYIGAFSSTRMLELVGEMGEGWFSWLVTPETYGKRREKIKRAAERVGRRLEDVDTVATIYTCITEDAKIRKKVMDSVRKEILQLDYYGLKSFGIKLPLSKRDKYQHILATEGHSPTFVETAKQIPDEVVKKYAAIGSVDDCIKFIEGFVGVGARHIAIVDFARRFIGDSLKTYGSKIIPYFKEQFKS